MRTPMVNPCQFIEVAGPPQARGLQYGRAAGERIALGISHYREQLARSDFGMPQIEAAVQQLLPLIEGFDPSFVPEMQAIAQGAEQPLAAIVLLNARTELLQIAHLRRGVDAQDDDPDGCTGVVVLPQASRHGRLIQAQNWDWKVDCAQTAVVLKIHPEDGSPDLLTFTEAGALARSGFNAAGISITANYLECDRDYRHTGVPLALIRRKVLQQSDWARALQAVYGTPKSASNNIMVSHAQGLSINFECAPDETFQVHATDDLLIHANHWLSPVALTKLRETGVKSTPDSLYRDLRVRSLLQPLHGRIETRHVKGALFDRFGGDWAVCRPPRKNLTHNLSASVAMVVMEPEAGLLEVAMLPALNREFQQFTLEMSFVRHEADPLLKE
jgi:isopenicillin-N N-acyltransferase-like protein